VGILVGKEGHCSHKGEYCDKHTATENLCVAPVLHIVCTVSLLV
jgi:hypothetical protein